MRMPSFPGGHPPKPGFCHGGELFCATSASDNPVETINKLTAVIRRAAPSITRCASRWWPCLTPRLRLNGPCHPALVRTLKAR